MKKILAIVLALATVLIVCGCSASVLSVEGNDDNTITVTADQAEVKSGGNSTITIGENQYLVFNLSMEKGIVSVRIVPEGTDVELVEEEMSGTSLTPKPLDPGTYVIDFTVAQKATGNITVLAMDREEFDQQGTDLVSALKLAGVENADEVVADLTAAEEAAALAAEGPQE